MAIPMFVDVSSPYLETPFERTYTLGRSVSAIPVLSGAQSSSVQLGLMTRLPEGAELDLRGPGFDDHTVRVRWGGQAYYVFLDDLELQRKRVASAVAG
jgi:hypothetical protein